ncbi:ice-binding family protein [Arthrobacter sp. NPDC092385]|uniref:ice-binding family protein n=1 Tax=Arthrobacter sp. NPDC092385 TaxID=3363943 RepID=UPI003824CD81
MAYAAEAPVGLGTAGSYSVLGGETVTNTGPTRLNANLGVSPGSAVTGFPPGITTGAINAANAEALQAKSDLTIAYNDAAGRALTESVADDLVGRTLPAGVYKSTGPLALSGTLTLDAAGDPNAVFIFQVAETLITASASNVVLIGGAQACNVYWQVGSSATLGTNSTFKGTILALTSISVTTEAAVEGRALARNGAVTLDNNSFVTSSCTQTPVPTVTATPAPTTSAPAPVPTVTTPAPVPTVTTPAPVPTVTTPAPVPTVTIPAPVPTVTIPAPVPTVTIPAPVPTVKTPALVPGNDSGVGGAGGVSGQQPVVGADGARLGTNRGTNIQTAASAQPEAQSFLPVGLLTGAAVCALFAAAAGRGPRSARRH